MPLELYIHLFRLRKKINPCLSITIPKNFEKRNFPLFEQRFQPIRVKQKIIYIERMPHILLIVNDLLFLKFRKNIKSISLL